MPEGIFSRSRSTVRIATIIALATGLLDAPNAMAGDSKSTASSKKQAVEVKPQAQCEQGRYWCAKRAECIKFDVPCQYQKNDFAF